MSLLDYWNNYPKPTTEVDVNAVDGDLVTEIGGILYLLQRGGDRNNVVCFRTSDTKVTTLQSFLMYRQYLIEKNIQYIRVEGNTRRYKFLANLELGEGYSVLQEDVKNRNIFYIKLY